MRFTNGIKCSDRGGAEATRRREAAAAAEPTRHHSGQACFQRDCHFIAEESAPAPHLAKPIQKNVLPYADAAVAAPTRHHSGYACLYADFTRSCKARSSMHEVARHVP